MSEIKSANLILTLALPSPRGASGRRDVTHRRPGEPHSAPNLVSEPRVAPAPMSNAALNPEEI